MAVERLCGEPTPAGKPCNMKRGHPAKFHRHRVYSERISWGIRLKSDELVDEGTGRMELGYAITKALKEHANLVIYINA